MNFEKKMARFFWRAFSFPVGIWGDGRRYEFGLNIRPTSRRPMPTFTNLTASVSNAPVTCRSAPNRNERQHHVPTDSLLTSTSACRRSPQRLNTRQKYHLNHLRKPNICPTERGHLFHYRANASVVCLLKAVNRRSGPPPNRPASLREQSAGIDVCSTRPARQSYCGLTARSNYDALSRPEAISQQS